MRKIKSLLCVLLTMIISLGSMVTVKADTEIKPYENHVAEPTATL